MSSSVAHVVVDALDTGKPYSTATIAHGFVFLSGLIPRAAISEVTTMPLRDQISAVFGDVQRVLRTCGTSTASIVKTTCYLVDAGHFTAFNEAYGEQMSSPFPARTTVVTQLAAPGVLFEMDVVAAVEHQTQASTP